MPQVKAEFTLPNSSTRHILELTDQDDLDTVITQFELDLPKANQLNQLKLRELNQIDPKSDPKITGTEFVQALHLLANSKLVKFKYNYFYLAKKQLTPMRIRNIFKEMADVPTEIEIKPFWFYFVRNATLATDDDLVETNSSTDANTDSQTENVKSETDNLQVAIKNTKKAYKDLLAVRKDVGQAIADKLKLIDQAEAYLARGTDNNLSDSNINNSSAIGIIPIESNNNSQLGNITPVVDNDNQVDSSKKEVPLSDVLLKPLDKAIEFYHKQINELERQARQVNKDDRELANGAKSYQNIMAHADETNISLAKQNEELTDQKIKLGEQKQAQAEFLAKNYGQFLNSDQAKLQFLQSFLNNINSPMAQKIVQGKPQKLWNFIKAVCEYDKTT